ncbi:MAG: hypothetical protein H0T69_07230 [Thermoleophilaceae bacterium]|nr:hypothetical protein [Thermoleophilaceae bacterium]
MPKTARRLARRYLPHAVRRAVVALRPGRGERPRDREDHRQQSEPREQRRQKSAPPEPPYQESLIRSLERGKSLDEALIAQVRSLNAAKEHERAQAIAESLREHPETRTLGHLAAGIVAFRRGFVELAWEELRPVPREAWARFSPAEYVRSGLVVAPEDALRQVRELVADDPPELQAKSWFEVLAPVFGFGAQDLARDVFEIFDRHVRGDSPLWRHAEMHRDWMRPWIASDADSPSAPSPARGRRTFAIMDYGHPSATKASANIGDHLQSIAALGHLTRHQGVRFHGRGELVDLLTRLSRRTRPDLQRHDVEADLEVITVHRDASMYEAIPEDTWVLCFGWFMHALFRMRHGFPLHRNLRPIFVSFHCNKRDLLTPEAVAYLKRYGPVGCRDWTTVYLLLSIGVPAFFSGCLTTTIDTVFPDLTEGPAADAPTAYVDAAAEDVPPGGITYKHSQEAVRRRSFVVNVDRAVDLLETYRRRHRGVVTSRLHCYLPARSVGVDVDFRPKNRSDIRFDGLIGLPDAAFGAMRDGLREKLESVFTAILTGRPEAEVYALWREITAADVTAAEERRNRESRLAPVSAGLEGRLQAVASRAVEHVGASDRPAGDPVHCAVVLPKRGGLSLSVLIASLLDHASRRLHVWVLARDGTDAIEQRLLDRFPQVTLAWVPIRGLARGLRTPSGEKPDAGRLIRLLLTDVLVGVDRVVLLPIPSVATADIAELADLDLGADAVAAPTTLATADISGFGVIHAAAARLGDMDQAAAALRRRAHARHRFDFNSFTTDLLVLDLERLRRDRFGTQALALVEEFGLDDLEALHYLLGPARASVPKRWAVVPTQTRERGPGLIYWADRVKPWQPELTPERERWRRRAAAFSAPG